MHVSNKKQKQTRVLQQNQQEWGIRAKNENITTKQTKAKKKKWGEKRNVKIIKTKPLIGSLLLYRSNKRSLSANCV